MFCLKSAYLSSHFLLWFTFELGGTILVSSENSDFLPKDHSSLSQPQQVVVTLCQTALVHLFPNSFKQSKNKGAHGWKNKFLGWHYLTIIFLMDIINVQEGLKITDNIGQNVTLLVDILQYQTISENITWWSIFNNNEQYLNIIHGHHLTIPNKVWKLQNNVGQTLTSFNNVGGY